MKITLIGDWEKATILMSTLNVELKAAALAAQRSLSEKLLRIIKGHLRNQDLDWVPLSDRYVKYKKRKGQNPDKILRFTDLYYQSIQSWRRANVYYVGVKENFSYPSGVSISEVANWLEYGTKKMPARPLWQPSKEELMGRNRLGSTMLLRDSIFLFLKARNYPITKRSITSALSMS